MKEIIEGHINITDLSRIPYGLYDLKIHDITLNLTDKHHPSLCIEFIIDEMGFTEEDQIIININLEE